MHALLGRGDDKGKGMNGKFWGKGQKGSSWVKGKGAYYCEDDGWNNWAPQQLLKIVPVVDPVGFAAPKKPAAKSAISHHQAPVETRNRFSFLHATKGEETNEDIPINLFEGEPYPALKPFSQEAKAKGETKTATAAVSPLAPQAFVASACLSPLQESMYNSNEHQHQNQSTTTKMHSYPVAAKTRRLM